MLVQVLKSKIHMAKVTERVLEYDGSITIDEEIVEKAGMYPNEKVLVVDIENGARFETYIIAGKRGSKEFCINGAAARLVEKNDRIIVMAFGIIEEKEVSNFKPLIVRMENNNEIKEIKKGY